MISNLDLYKVFYEAARYESFSEAAKNLFVTQSSISQSIKSLETELQISLFDRMGKRITLTNEGRYLKERLEKIFTLIDSSERNLSSMASLEKGQLRIGASDTICKYYLIPKLEAFKKLYPGIRISIDNMPTPATIASVLDGRCDIGLVSVDHGFVHDGISTREVFEIEEGFVYSPEDYKISELQLDKYPLVTLGKNTNTRKYLGELFKENGMSLKPEIELISVDLVVEFAKSGLGVGFADLRAAESYLKSGELKIIKTDLALRKRRISLIRSAARPLSTVGKAFEQLFDELEGV